MRRPAARFTIRGLMAVTAIVAGLLALPAGLRELSAVLVLPCLAIFTARRLVVAGRRRVAAVTFCCLAIAVNVLFVILCHSPSLLYIALFFAWLVGLMPILAAFGIAWAVLEGRHVKVMSTLNRWPWVCMITLTLLPAVTALTLWPFWLAFVLARPALERMADQVAAGQSVSLPQYAGSFLILGSRKDPEREGVALILDPNPNGPGGFVRHRGPRIGPYACYSPIRGDWWHMSLGGGWCYHEED